MEHSPRPSEVRAAWHALFAPLPADALPIRRHVAPPEVLAMPEGAAIAGWDQLVLDLSDAPNGLRVVLVVLDAHGRPVSASDWVLHSRERPGRPEENEPATVVEHRHESVGGRLEPDGTFRGTRWLTESVDTPEGDTLETASTPSEPSAEDVAAIKALVAEMLRRAAPRAATG
jgi:hypothetical protein